MEGKEKIKKGMTSFASRAREYFDRYISSYKKETGEKSRAVGNAGAVARSFFKGMAVFAASYMFSGAEVFLSAEPFGVSLFFSCANTAVYAFAGMAIRYLYADYGIAKFVILSLIFSVRVLVTFLTSREKRYPTLFDESTAMRLFMATATSALLGAVNIISNGFLYYDIFGTLTAIALTPVCTLLFLRAFDGQSKYTPLYEAGVAAICMAAIYSLGEVSAWGFSLSGIAATVATLYISREGGILRGGVYGMIAGLATSPEHAPIFGLAGLVAGLFWRSSDYLASASAVAVALTFGLYVDGISSIRTFAPDVLVGAILFSLITAMNIKNIPKIFATGVREGDIALNRAAAEKRKMQATSEHLLGISDALGELSETFWKISDKMQRPSRYEIRQSVSDAFESECVNCAMCSLCQQRDYSDTIAVYDKLARTMQKRGEVTKNDLPDYMRERCRDIDKIMAKISLSYANLAERVHRMDKTEVFAADYEAMAKIIEDAAEAGRDFEENEAMSKKAREALKTIDFAASAVSVYGERDLWVVAGGVDLSRVKMTSEEIRSAFENVLGVHLNDPEFAIDGDFVTMTMRSRKILIAETASASEKKKEETVNGDMTSSFESRDGHYYAIISDGMGSGRDAALSSRLCGVFCEKMLSAGNSKAVTLELLNYFIRQKSTECFATLDMLELDLINGKASFIKSGAAPSYIMREGSIFRIASNSMPIGITRYINAEEIKFELVDGDVVVMVSDGVSDSIEGGSWLCEELTYRWKDDLAVMAEQILAEAKKRNIRTDDMTVALTRVGSR